MARRKIIQRPDGRYVFVSRRANARRQVIALSEWATMDSNQAADWVDSNVRSLADAKVALKQMAQMLVSLRDAVFDEEFAP